MNSIELISIEELQHHPDNPRKDFGDLEELAESIKANGIMQNLTVVRSDDGTGLYDVIIGNRRLEAAKLAELDELPCVVVEMSPQEQMATMLAENMQREDLTIPEQAKGIQYMLDLGETVDSISEKTGFTKRTIRRRVKLLELDSEKLNEAFGRQVSIEEIDNLNSIEDLDARNKLLSSIGTGNWKWEYNRVKDRQDVQSIQSKVREIMSASYTLPEVDIKLSWNGAKKTVGHIYLTDNGKPKKSEALEAEIFDAVTDEKYLDVDCYAFNGRTLCFLAEHIKASSNDNEPSEEEKRETERRKHNAEELKEIAKTAYKLRYEFIKEYTKTQAKKHYKIILAVLARMSVEIATAEWNADLYDAQFETFGELSEISVESEQEYETSSASIIDNAPDKMLLNYVYSLFGDSEREAYTTWDNGHMDRHRGNPELDYLYAFLEKLGYEMSDAEKSLQNGTHELFYKPDAEGDSNGE